MGLPSMLDATLCKRTHHGLILHQFLVEHLEGTQMFAIFLLVTHILHSMNIPYRSFLKSTIENFTINDIIDLY